MEAEYFYFIPMIEAAESAIFSQVTEGEDLPWWKAEALLVQANYPIYGQFSIGIGDMNCYKNALKIKCRTGLVLNQIPSRLNDPTAFIRRVIDNMDVASFYEIRKCLWSEFRQKYWLDLTLCATPGTPMAKLTILDRSMNTIL